MKTIKSLTEAEISELPILPDEWKWTKIGDLCDLINGRAFKPTEWSSHGTPIVRIQNLNNKEADFNYCDFRVEDKYYLNNGQLLFAWSGTPGTSFGAHIWSRGEAVLNQHIFKVNINESYTDKKFLMYVMNWNVTEYVKKAHGTAGLAHITKNKFETSFISFPPLPEQRAIVSKIELLFSELDNGIDNLKLAQAQLKVYRQAVLKKAFEGELTKKWREQLTDLPDAGDLLEQIRKEREEAAKVSGKKQKSIQSLTEDELAELTRLPEGWRWTRLGQVVWSVKDGPHYSPKYEENGIPFISGGNVRPSGVDFSNTKYISKELHEELSKRCKPELNDILYTKGGTTGIARVNTYDFDFNVWVHVAVLKTIKSIYPFYLQHALNSFHCYRQSQKYTHGVGNQDLGLTRMILITLPICSLPEQHTIVQEIETRLSVCDKIEQDIKENLEKAEALRQSILKKAFEGKLLNERELAEVRRAEDWEPAEVLLERIRVEKAASGKKGRS
ncbi:Type I restriction-modification system, specificity subunit S [Methanosarcina lacustris Z-7289]|uniref:Type I restriction-modification system, specificity subunit S n=1 Tax=Methanosarcina lacustris Z-7289 TaxID=1434111 RepID=A0A0E3S2G5_9EURY|nr:restriction endonuclease subunit S [Methanosarcina lacustris]AKB74989.1 Type I restriction-modification system, specificity subunit S [Methanosarcina lacustris Z-7289]